MSSVISFRPDSGERALDHLAPGWWPLVALWKLADRSTAAESYPPDPRVGDCRGSRSVATRIPSGDRAADALRTGDAATPAALTWVGAAAGASSDNHSAAQQKLTRRLPTIYSARHRPPTMTCYNLPVRSTIIIERQVTHFVTQSASNPQLLPPKPLALNCLAIRKRWCSTAGPFRRILTGLSLVNRHDAYWHYRGRQGRRTGR